MIFRSKIYTYSKTPNICRNNISNGSNHLGTRFCLYVHHTDADREWAYDRTSSIDRLDKGLDEANAKGWTVVNMKAERAASSCACGIAKIAKPTGSKL
jgi:hypothetical protein